MKARLKSTGKIIEVEGIFYENFDGSPLISSADIEFIQESPWKIVANEPPPEYTDVLLSAGSRPDIFVGYFNGEDFRIRSTEETIEYFRVLHWMPIPE